MRHPSWDDIRRFCEVDGWEATHSRRGRKRRDHDRYTKTLPDGRILRTRASHGNAQIGDPALVTHILRDQLEVSADEFWHAVDNGEPPSRGQPEAATEHHAPALQLPGWLAVNLAVNVGMSDDEISDLDEDQATAIWLDWCARKQDE